MNKRTITIFFFCLLFAVTYGDGVTTKNRNNNSVKASGADPQVSGCDGSKACTIDHISEESAQTRRRRSAPIDKRTFRNMLLGLVHKKDSVHDSIVEEDTHKLESDASELLLELMVRIAAHPQQWNEVHELLKKIDSDILTSKKIITELQNVEESTTTSSVEPTEPNETNKTQNTTEEVQRLIIVLDNKERPAKNNTVYEWPNLNENITDDTKSNEDTNKLTTQNIYPWSSKPIKASLPKEFEFAYHRVTGRPLPHSNYDKTRSRNAYIAVSVIAPKSRNVRLEKSENLLEEELRQLKPWSHQENLNKMENIRKKWFLDTDEPQGK